MPAVAVTDQSNLFGLVKFYTAAMAGGIKPIAGADVWIDQPESPDTPARLTLLVQNVQGYRNLTELISRSYLENQHLGVPRIRREWLSGQSAGLLALSGGQTGDIGRSLLRSHTAAARASLESWCEVFDHRFYLELSRTGKPDEALYIGRACDLALATGTPIVATNDVCFLSREDFYAHEARVCIYQGRIMEDERRPRDYSDQQYLRSAEEMVELFRDLPEALANTVEIAKRCNLEVEIGKNYLPEFPVPEGMTPEQFFQKEARSGLGQRLVSVPAKKDPDKVKTYEERLELELAVIINMGFTGYFLIVADFIQWAKNQGIPVGPGRGSGAGSLVAYALRITDLDPISYDLLFERFLNPERVSMPDFDIDFCMERRDEVIDYVASKYGRDRVSQIITYGSMAAKAVVRDVGRVLGHPYSFVDRIAKLIPFELGMTLEKALEESQDLMRSYEHEDEVRGLLDLARQLEGLTRNPGKHAGGVVIAPSRLVDFAPLYCEPGGDNLVTQFDKDDVEAVGLVKFDFLGLRTLTIIDWALRNINAKLRSEGRAVIDINAIPTDDPRTYQLLKNCATTAIFQLESRGMKDLIRRLMPDSFEDIIALVALFRPGPLQSGMVDDYINVKHGRMKAEYPHPVLEPILGPTNGVILYQEQVMQIARDMAGYTLGGADMLRRAMGKKKPEEMAKQRSSFISGAVAKEVSAEVAHYIFDLMEKFAGYGFNKSHSAAYALLSYQTAWLKAHYPCEFMASVLSADMDNTDKVVILIEECRELKIQVLPPDINVSAAHFTVPDARSVLYGLGAMKGVGLAAIDEILQERKKGGLFANLGDFCRRIDSRKVNRRVIEALIRGGAMDGLGANRSNLMSILTVTMKAAEQHQEMRSGGQTDLFGELLIDVAPEVIPDAVEGIDAEWSEAERLSHEKATLGLYLSGHPITPYENELRQWTQQRLGALGGEPPERSGRHNESKVSLGGLILEIQERSLKNGNKMASALLDDRTGRMHIVLYAEVHERFRAILREDAVVFVEGTLGYDDFASRWRVNVENLMTFEQAREARLKSIELDWHAMVEKRGAARSIERLQQCLSPFLGGKTAIQLVYATNAETALVQLGDAWRVHPRDELLLRLRRLFGAKGVSLNYRAGATKGN